MDPASEQAAFGQPTQSSSIPPAPPRPAGSVGQRGSGAVIVGLALVVPALIALIFNYLLPTIWTVANSFQDVNLLRNSSQPVGTKNYETISENLPGTLGFALAFAALPLLTFLLAAPLLALAAHHTGVVGRWVARIALAVPMVCIAPAGLAVSYLFQQVGQQSTLSNPATATGSLLAGVWMGTFGLVCGVGVTLFLATLRRRANDQGSVLPALFTVAGLGVLAVPAIALQVFTYPYVVTGGGPNRATMTPMLEMFDFGFRIFRVGAGAAEATIVLALLGVLGLLAAVLVILTGLRIELDPVRRSADEPTGWPSSRIVAALLGGLALVAILGMAWSGVSPMLSAIVSRTGGEQIAITSSGTLLVNTWLPPLISAFVAVGLAAVAGFGIGALRPLGRFSELLLLPFAPWLFVGIAPLALAKWTDAREAELVNTFVGLIPPVGIAIPALFVFTLLFKGQERRRQELLAEGTPAGQAYLRTILPTLPMLALVGGFSWLIMAQDVLWPLLVATDRDLFTGPLTMLMAVQQFSTTTGAPVFLALPLAVVVIAALILIAAQVLYLDRIAIRAGRR